MGGTGGVRELDRWGAVQAGLLEELAELERVRAKALASEIELLGRLEDAERVLSGLGGGGFLPIELAGTLQISQQSAATRARLAGRYGRC